MQKLKATVSALACTAALAACSSADLPDYVKLGALRVLALQADLPEVNPADGKTITITPVVSDLNRGGRPLAWSAEACPDPGVSLGASPSCAGVPGAVTIPGAGFAAPGAASKTYTGTAPTFTLTVPAAVFNNRSAVDQANGVAYLVIYHLTASDGSGDHVDVVKRIIASTQPVHNTNPQIASVTMNGTSLGFLPAVTPYPANAPDQTMAVTETPASTETYTQIASNGTTLTQTETLTATWFYIDGSFAYYRTVGTDSNTWTPGAAPSGRNSPLVVVVRDNRGGEDFRQLEFH